MNPQLTTRLRSLRLSGMVDALPGRVATAILDRFLAHPMCK